MPKPVRKAGRLRLIAVFFAAWVVMAGVPAFGLYYSLSDYLRRDAILDGGAGTRAVVDRIRYGESRTGALVCTTILSYTVGATRYRSEWRGCGNKTREGQSVPVAYDPAEPDGAFAVSEGRWPEGRPSGTILLALLFSLLTAGFWAAAKSALPEQED